MSNPKWEERILAVRRTWLFCHGDQLAFQGLNLDRHMIKLLMQHVEEGWEIKRRGDKTDPTPAHNNAEINYEFKQPIPYTIIKRGNEIFLYKRLSGSGESRLHNKSSIGVGGHMNKEDGKFIDILKTNLYRELSEELSFTSNEMILDIIGLINDDSDSVGKVHLGILIIAHIPLSTEVSVKETDQLEGEWISIENLKQPEVFDKLENWSKIASEIL